jgi:hypothetical protein
MFGASRSSRQTDRKAASEARAAAAVEELACISCQVCGELIPSDDYLEHVKGWHALGDYAAWPCTFCGHDIAIYAYALHLRHWHAYRRVAAPHPPAAEAPAHSHPSSAFADALFGAFARPSVPSHLTSMADPAAAPRRPLTPVPDAADVRTSLYASHLAALDAGISFGGVSSAPPPPLSAALAGRLPTPADRAALPRANSPPASRDGRGGGESKHAPPAPAARPLDAPPLALDRKQLVARSTEPAASAARDARDQKHSFPPAPAASRALTANGDGQGKGTGGSNPAVVRADGEDKETGASNSAVPGVEEVLLCDVPKCGVRVPASEMIDHQMAHYLNGDLRGQLPGDGRLAWPPHGAPLSHGASARAAPLSPVPPHTHADHLADAPLSPEWERRRCTLSPEWERRPRGPRGAGGLLGDRVGSPTDEWNRSWREAMARVGANSASAVAHGRYPPLPPGFWESCAEGDGWRDGASLVPQKQAALAAGQDVLAASAPTSRPIPHPQPWPQPERHPQPQPPLQRPPLPAPDSGHGGLTAGASGPSGGGAGGPRPFVLPESAESSARGAATPQSGKANTGGGSAAEASARGAAEPDVASPGLALALDARVRQTGVPIPGAGESGAGKSGTRAGESGAGESGAGESGGGGAGAAGPAGPAQTVPQAAPEARGARLAPIGFLRRRFLSQRTSAAVDAAGAAQPFAASAETRPADRRLTPPSPAASHPAPPG